MKKITLLSTALGGILAAALSAPANAQASRTWVSGVGDDANPCSRTAPCKTFAGAISKTAANGEINCLDSGGFGAVTITKSITIKCEGVIGGILASLVNGVNVNDSATATPGTIIVTLSGLDIEGFANGINGVNFTSGAAVHIHKTQIRGFRGSGNGGISVSSTSNKELYVADSYITDNGNSSVTGGIVVNPTGSNTVQVHVNRTQIENNTAGIITNVSAPNTAVIKGEVRDSVVAGSTNNGITTSSGGASVVLTIDNVTVSGNGNGLVATGSGAGQLVGRSTITANTTAVSATAPASILSYLDNLMNNNGGGEAFSGPVPGGKK